MACACDCSHVMSGCVTEPETSECDDDSELFCYILVSQNEIQKVIFHFYFSIFSSLSSLHSEKHRGCLKFNTVFLKKQLKLKISKVTKNVVNKILDTQINVVTFCRFVYYQQNIRRTTILLCIFLFVWRMKKLYLWRITTSKTLVKWDAGHFVLWCTASWLQRCLSATSSRPRLL